ncbi:Hypothetical Protein RradSPS_2881 (plasmid) [Rubrobacter radiotolerans]|uniref:Replication-relaxation n=1 Tax=Rubrobacter radiotolerans TaxID=42256 RepID=A0A023X7X9_RUBRA|nr:hypothetical protein [Rubrobacter radiotolerans]AHY48164.1 Hypothetical Protein RradSPS_2881 [Rubrobacter radiotolerans]MDX5895423.1 hypothetical protein [Rubrobacter radiotolerans]
MPDPFIQNAPRRRDQRALTALFSTTVLLTKQLEEIVYDSYSHARKQLYAMGKSGYLERIVPEFRTSEGKLWILTKRAFFRELRGSKLYYDESYPELPRRLEHVVATNDVYVGVRDELEHRFGDEEAGWHWKHEGRAFDRFEMGSRRYVHQPDAELCFGERVLYIERETGRAREAPSRFNERTKSYAARERFLSHERLVPEVVWACDTERDTEHALAASRRHGVRAVCGTPEQIISYIKEAINEEADRLGLEPFKPEVYEASPRAQRLLRRAAKKPHTNGSRPVGRDKDEVENRLPF